MTTTPARGARSSPSVTDVARKAGVSLGTVSNAMNHPHKLSPATLHRVEQAIAELGFVRNGAASALAAGVSTTLGIVLVDLGNSLFVDMARGAESEAQRRGFHVFLTDSNIDMEKQNAYLRLFDETRVAGVVLAPLEGSLEGMEQVRTHGRPVVLLNRLPDHHGSCAVVVDERRGGYLAAQHLIDLGRRRLIFVGEPKRYQAVRERLIGAQQAVQDAGEGITMEIITTKGLKIAHGVAVGGALRQRPAKNRPDGIVASSDLLAVGCIQALHNQGGIQIPRDISVVGYDNNHFASDSLVPVSTIAQPAQDMGRAAVDLVLDEAHTGAGHVHRTVTLSPELIIRQSSRPDPR